MLVVGFALSWPAATVEFQRIGPSASFIPTSLTVTATTIRHPPGVGRFNCLTNPGDYAQPLYNCGFIRTIDVSNTSNFHINDLWLHIDGDELSYRPRQLINHIFAEPKLSEVDRAQYVFQYLTDAMYHFTPGTYDNASPMRGLKAYGFAWCTDMAWAFMSIMNTYGGHPVRMSEADEHDVAEVFIDDAWRFYDPDHRVWLTDTHYQPLSLLAFKALPNPVIPRQMQRSSEGEDKDRETFLRLYTATATNFSEGAPPIGEITEQNPLLTLPPHHRLTYDYAAANASYAGIEKPDADQFLGNIRYHFNLGDIHSLEDMQTAVNMNADNFTFDGKVLRAKVDTFIEYSFGSEFPIVDVTRDIEGEGLCINIAADGAPALCSGTPKLLGPGKFSYADYLRDRRVVNTVRDRGPIITNSTVNFYSIKIEIKAGGWIDKMNIDTAIQFNKQLFPRATSGTRSLLVASYRQVPIADPISISIATDPAPSAEPAPPLPKLQKISRDQNVVAVDVNSRVDALEWRVVNAQGLPVHPNLMGWEARPPTFKITLLGPEEDGLFLVLRSRIRGRFSNFSEPIPLRECTRVTCPDVIANDNNLIGALPLPQSPAGI